MNPELKIAIFILILAAIVISLALYVYLGGNITLFEDSVYETGNTAPSVGVTIEGLPISQEVSDGA